MTQDEIIRMAREAGIAPCFPHITVEDLERFADLVAAHKREKQAEQEPVGWTHAANLVDDGYGHIFSVHSSEPAYDDWIPLYAAPVQQFDLTDDEMDDIYQAAKIGNLLELRRAVIAAYKEKNK